tara:strand:+ start:789 stop:1403 length:615 start_codon:yes stop_codon:yes gene_type:complete
MTIVSSGAISINSLVGEYGGSAPHAMNEYYRGGGLVANHSNNGNVPTSGVIQLDDFYGANNTSPAPTSYSYGITLGSPGGGRAGFASGSGGFGSLSNNPQSTAFAGGFNPTITELSTLTSLNKAAQNEYSFFLRVSGNISNSGWTSITVPSGITNSSSNQTLNRSSVTSYNYNSGSNITSWEFSLGTGGFQFNTSGSGTVTITE